jgi:hypothetical protein
LSAPKVTWNIPISTALVQSAPKVPLNNAGTFAEMIFLLSITNFAFSHASCLVKGRADGRRRQKEDSDVA